MGEEIEVIDLSRLFNMFWDKKLHIIIIICMSLILGCLYIINFWTPVYTSSITLLLTSSQEGDSTITSSDINLNSKLISTYRQLIKSKNTLNEVIENLNLDMTVEDLSDSIEVSSVTNTSLIKVTVTNADSDIAVDIADEIAKVFPAKVKEMYNIDNIQLISEADIPNGPSNSNHTKEIVMFLVMGLAISCVYVFICNLLDTTIKSSEEIEREYGLYVLASIPIYTDKIKKVKGGK